MVKKVSVPYKGNRRGRKDYWRMILENRFKFQTKESKKNKIQRSKYKVNSKKKVFKEDNLWIPFHHITKKNNFIFKDPHLFKSQMYRNYIPWEGKNSIPSSPWHPDFYERKSYSPQESGCFIIKDYTAKSSLVVWALHNHPHRILQLSIGIRLPTEAQDALI